jgi:hypothetical protein
MRISVAASTILALAAIAGCKTANSALDTVKSAGETVADGAVSLVNVNLSNVLNDLSLDLKIDKANIPINAQIPITIAANVCGVNINILSISGGGSPNCTANSISPELKQYIQQQLAANGSVGGGAQTTNTQTPVTTNTQTPVTTNTTTNTVNTTEPQTSPQ